MYYLSNSDVILSVSYSLRKQSSEIQLWANYSDNECAKYNHKTAVIQICTRFISVLKYSFFNIKNLTSFRSKPLKHKISAWGACACPVVQVVHAGTIQAYGSFVSLMRRTNLNKWIKHLRKTTWVVFQKLQAKTSDSMWMHRTWAYGSITPANPI